MADYSLPPLSEVVPGYPATAPQAGDALAAMDPHDVRAEAADFGWSPEELALVLAIRQHCAASSRANKTFPIHNLDGLIQRLERAHLSLEAKMWQVWKLEPDFTFARIHNSRRIACRTYKRVPGPHVVRDELPAGQGEGYIITYGGSPSILAISTVADEIAELLADLPIADVCFVHLKSGEQRSVFSLLEGRGKKGNEILEFPNIEAAVRARLGRPIPPLEQHQLEEAENVEELAPA